MSKIVLAISGGVTAFVLALTAGAVYVSRNLTTTSAAAQAATSQPTSVMQPVVMADAATSTPAVVANVAAQDAAALAAKYLNRTDLYSVELADFQGAQAYKVTFSSGDIVMVSMQGQVVSTTPPPTPQIVTVAGGGGGGGGGGGSHHGGGDGESEGSDGEGH
jgi:uncharacterized membrane protein YgcG